MHSHGNPKGSGRKFFAAGQPCKIGEDNEGVSEDNLDRVHHLEIPGSMLRIAPE
jgi:hypothetical protein